MSAELRSSSEILVFSLIYVYVKVW